MKGMDARLDRIEDKLDAQRRRKRMKDRPGVVVLYDGDPIPEDLIDPETGRGPLIIMRTRKDSIASEGR